MKSFAVLSVVTICFAMQATLVMGQNCLVEFERKCDAVPATNTCSGTCDVESIGDYCGLTALVSNVTTYQWVKQVPPGASGKDSYVTGNHKKCGYFYDCYCNYTVALGDHCAFLGFYGEIPLMQGQASLSGDDCTEPPLPPTLPPVATGL
jgi:hypothetical protein